MRDGFDKLIRDAREEWGKTELGRVDWEVADRKLFARIARERRAEIERLASGNRRAWALGAVALTAIAMTAIVGGKMQDERSLDARQLLAEERTGSLLALTAIEGNGEVLIDGRRAVVGSTLGLGSVVEPRDAQPTVQVPGKLTFVVERSSRVSVVHLQGPVVLALDAGAIEAQVVPVARGEAFAVDVGRSRVAVHGTHLRVSRAGDHVVIDLNEGTVSVGEAPRRGSTSGTMVMAPAHAEFSAEDALGTLTVSHDPSAVRPPLALGAPEQSAVSSPATGPASSRSEAHEFRAGSASTVAPPRADLRLPSSALPPSPRDPNAETTLAAAVRSCLGERPSAENVTVSVSTTLHLTLRDDGSVRLARFDPPVAPDVNGCAAQAIYKTRFARSGDVAIGVDFRAPSSTR
jgi:hypothetical protein